MAAIGEAGEVLTANVGVSGEEQEKEKEVDTHGARWPQAAARVARRGRRRGEGLEQGGATVVSGRKVNGLVGLGFIKFYRFKKCGPKIVFMGCAFRN